MQCPSLALLTLCALGALWLGAPRPADADDAQCSSFRRSVLSRDRLNNQQLDRKAFANVGQWDGQRQSWTSQPQTLSTRARVYVLNFWAHYCPPCVHELPALLTAVRDVAQGRSADVQLMLLAEETSAPEMTRFLSQNLPLARETYLSDTGGVVRHQLGIETLLPITVVLDRDLVVRYAVVGAIEDIGQLKEQIDRLLRLRR